MGYPAGASPLNFMDDNGNKVIEISPNVLFIGLLIISLLLIGNLIFLCYINCSRSGHNEQRIRKRKYNKVSQIVSSDDDMKNLKEYAI